MRRIIWSVVFLVALTVNSAAQIQGAIQTAIANKIAASPAALKAAEKNDLPALKQAVEQNKAAAYVSDKDGWTPLMYAARNSNLEMVKYLLSKGAKVNTERKNYTGDSVSALYYALWSPEITDLLLKNGAKVKPYLVKKAIESSTPTALRIVEEYGSNNIKKANSKSGNLYLSLAADTGNARVAEKLLDLGADLNTCYLVGDCAFWLATGNAWDNFLSEGLQGTVFEVFSKHKALNVNRANLVLREIIIETSHDKKGFGMPAIQMLVEGFYSSHDADQQKALLAWEGDDGNTAEDFARAYDKEEIADYLQAARKK